MSSSGQGSIVEAFNRQKKKQQQEQQRSMVQIHRDLDVTIKIEPTTDGEEEDVQQQRPDFGGSGDSPEAQVRTLLDSEHRTSLANPNVEDAITIEVVEEEIAAPAKTKGKRKAKAQGKAQRTLDKFVTVVSTPAKRPRR